MRTPRLGLVGLSCLALAAIFVSSRFSEAQPAPNPNNILNYPAVGVDPIVNIVDMARVSFPGEWQGADHVLDVPPERGTMYGESRLGWFATSSHNQNTVYPDRTLFFLHDISSFDILSDVSFNTFELSFMGHDLDAWVLAGGDEPNDAGWLPGSGLEVVANPNPPPLLIERAQLDDRGFVVRLDRNPLTERHWFPDGPPFFEPGDPQWSWDEYYGFFGTWGFNNTTFQFGLPHATANINQVYECAWRPGEWADSCIFVVKKISDIKNTNQVNVVWHVGPEHIGGPPETPWAPQSMPKTSHVYKPYGETALCSFYIVNPESLAQTFNGYKWDTRGWTSAGPVSFSLSPKEMRLVQYSVSVPNSSGLVGALDTVWVNDGRSYETFAVLEVSDHPGYLFVSPNQAEVAVGETLFCSALSYDPAGRPVEVSPLWQATGGIGTLTQETREVLPLEMEVVGFVAGSAGSGYVKASVGGLSDSVWVTVTAVSGVEGEDLATSSLPVRVVSFPNPFRSSTQIRFALRHAASVDLAVYDLSGRLVRVLESGERGGGWHCVDWDGKDAEGASVEAGVYFYRLRTSDGGVRTGKMVVLR